MALAFTFLITSVAFTLTTAVTSISDEELSVLRKNFGIDDIIHEETIVGNAIDGYTTVTSPKTRWPNGIIPYEFHPTRNNHTQAQRDFIEKTMAEISTKVCIKFVKKTNESTYVSIVNDDTKKRCFSSVGYTLSPGPRNVQLANWCLAESNSTVIHELMHAMGFHHEQTRYDRDLYLRVNWHNIPKESVHNYNKYPRTLAFPRYPYDFKSVMQYGLYTISYGSMDMLYNPDYVNILNELGSRSKRGLYGSDIDRITSAYKNICALGPDPPIPDPDTLRQRKYSNFF